jgi:hypothetical protein
VREDRTSAIKGLKPATIIVHRSSICVLWLCVQVSLPRIARSSRPLAAHRDNPPKPLATGEPLSNSKMERLVLILSLVAAACNLLAVHAGDAGPGDSSASRALLQQSTFTCDADIPACRPGRCSRRDVGGDLVSAPLEASRCKRASSRCSSLSQWWQFGQQLHPLTTECLVHPATCNTISGVSCCLLLAGERVPQLQAKLPAKQGRHALW